MDLLKIRSYWKHPKKPLWHFTCPLCKIPRQMSIAPKIKKKYFFQIAFTALISTGLTWSWMHWKGIVVFIPFWMLFEIIYRLRVRIQLPCSSCGFDPYLFLINLQSAKEGVEKHWREKLKAQGIPYPEKKDEVKKHGFP